jgi:aspartyl-tRNA(Asn)/glutamyl-tRNA(Gln) amidotransferase subunit A
MADSELIFQPVSKLAALLKSRQLSPVELVRAYLDRIDAVNDRVRAFLTITRDQALAQAQQAEREITAGRYRGPLHGIPYAPKDLLATKGIRTTNGSKVTADWTPDYESTVTARLNEAGAILIGKLQLVEFAMGSHLGAPFGITRNPWDLAYSPSGSSSGPGAAVAARMTPLAIGTDTGGSIRKPANSCGIVGLKPTYGRVSRFGITTLSWTLDNAGPMTQTVADNALLLAAIAGPDPQDPTAAQEAVPDYTKAMTGDVKGLRIGVPTNYFYEGFDAEAVAAIHAALDVLHGLGAELVDVTIANADLVGPASSIIRMSEAASYHEKRMREHADLFEPLVRENLEAATFYSAVDYVKAMRVRALLVQEMRRVFGLCDVLAVPAANAAPKLEPDEPTAGAETKAPPTPLPDTFNLGNMAGIPAIVQPCGFTSGPPTLPLGIQLYAKAFDEPTLFRVSHAYESATDWHTRRPPLTA